MRCLKKLCFEIRTVTKSNPERDFFSFCQNEESMQMFASFSSEQVHKADDACRNMVINILLTNTPWTSGWVKRSEHRFLESIHLT